MIVFLNDRFVKSDDARISPFDRGFLTGEGLFETVRVYSGHPFALDRHIERLAEGSLTVGIEPPPSLAELRSIVDTLIERNRLKDARLRLTLTKGEEGAKRPTLFVSATPYGGYPEHLYREGMSVKSLSGFRSSSMPVFGVKSTSYLISKMALASVKAEGFDETVLLNEQSEVAEGATANIFAVFGERILTPSIKSGALPGITRAILLDVLPTKGISVDEGVISISDLHRADEIFLTNSLMEVMPVTHLDGASVGGGVPGPSILKIAEMYKALVDADISAAQSCS